VAIGTDEVDRDSGNAAWAGGVDERTAALALLNGSNAMESTSPTTVPGSSPVNCGTFEKEGEGDPTGEYAVV
jgi:hypothetical protein